MTFYYTRFPVNKLKVEKNFKIMRKSLFNYSFYSHPEIWKFQGVTEDDNTISEVQTTTR
jgi:hypothetical protein